jgi:hypothetical protein
MTTAAGRRGYRPPMPMKRIVLTFGLISGALSAGMMLATLVVVHRIGFDRGEIIGYTGIVLSFLMVFFGIRSYREHAGGTISFARGFTIGLLIALVSSACYVAAWEIIYWKMWPNFVDDYAAYAIEHARASGASPETVAATTRQMAEFKEMYSKPLINVAMTLMEPLPVGIIVSIISAAVLRRRPTA